MFENVFVNVWEFIYNLFLPIFSTVLFLFFFFLWRYELEYWEWYFFSGILGLGVVNIMKEFLSFMLWFFFSVGLINNNICWILFDNFLIEINFFFIIFLVVILWMSLVVGEESIGNRRSFLMHVKKIGEY